jgi:flagellar hook-length control protein FliK
MPATATPEAAAHAAATAMPATATPEAAAHAAATATPATATPEAAAQAAAATTSAAATPEAAAQAAAATTSAAARQAAAAVSLATAAGGEPSVEQTAATPATTATAFTAAGSADSPDVTSPLNTAAFLQAAFRLRQNVVISDPSPIAHEGTGTQSRDPNGARGDTQGPAGRLAGTDAAASAPVAVGSATTSFVSETSGEFAVHLDGVIHLEGAVTPGSAVPLSPRSDFIVSNAALTAAISKPLNEGSGVYSVTAMLNPPSLGHVQAVVKVDGTNVNVSIVAHTPEGHHAIAGHLDELRQELQTRGGDVQLSLSDGGSRAKQHGETEPPVASGEDAADSEDAGTLLPTAVPAQAGKSLHVIL